MSFVLRMATVRRAPVAPAAVLLHLHRGRCRSHRRPGGPSFQSVRAVFYRGVSSLQLTSPSRRRARFWTPEAKAQIDRRLSEFGATGQTGTIETPTMITPADQGGTVARMAEPRAVGDDFR